MWILCYESTAIIIILLLILTSKVDPRAVMVNIYNWNLHSSEYLEFMLFFIVLSIHFVVYSFWGGKETRFSITC